MKSIAAAFLFLSASPAFADDALGEHVGVRVREWFARMAGTIEADGGSGFSDQISLGSDLGLSNRHLTHEVQAYGRIPLVGRLYAGWWEHEDSGSNVLSRTINFAGQTYTITSNVASSTKLDVYYLNYEFVFPTIPAGDLVQVELALQAGIRALHGWGSIASGLINGADGGWVGFPTIGGHVTVGIASWVRVEAEVLGLAFSYGSDRMSYIEAYGEAVFTPVPWVFVGVGYKYASLAIHHRPPTEIFEFLVGVSGIYITAGFRF